MEGRGEEICDLLGKGGGFMYVCVRMRKKGRKGREDEME